MNLLKLFLNSRCYRCDHLLLLHYNYGCNQDVGDTDIGLKSICASTTPPKKPNDKHQMQCRGFIFSKEQVVKIQRLIKNQERKHK